MTSKGGKKMNGEYRTLATNSIEADILFYGLERCRPGHVFRGNNIRSNYVLHFIFQGQGEFAVANQHLTTLHAGDIFLLPKGKPAFYQADQSEPWTYFWIGFNGLNIDTILEKTKLAQRYFLKDVQGSRFANTLTQLYQALHNEYGLANDLHIKALTFEMFFNLLNEFPGSKSPSHNQTELQFQAAVNYLKANYQAGCTVTDLAHHLALSRSYVYDLFKRYANSSPQQFLTRQRMEDAKQQLITTALPIKEIASGVGYSDTYTFSKAFKRYAGASPNAYRQQNRL